MSEQTRDFLQQLWQFAQTVRRRYAEDRCTRVAGSLSFTTLFALVPLIAVAVAMLSVFPVFQSWITSVDEFIYGNFVPAAGEAVQKYLHQFVANAGKLTVWGLLFVIITALLLMATIEKTFNDIWHVSQTRKRLHRFLAYWALLTLGPVLIGLSLSLTSYLISLPLLAEQSAFGGFRVFLLAMLPVLFEIIAFMLLYTVVPSHPVRLRHALIGSVFSAILFEITKRAFGFFVLYFSSYKVIYGAVAALPVFLIWIYLSWMVVLLGAVVTATLPEWKLAARVSKRKKRVRKKKF